MTRPTNIGRPFPLLTVGAILDSGGYASGQVPTATGSNGGVAWSSNVALITSNSSNALLGPFVNFASGSNVIFSVASNTLTIASTGGGAGDGFVTVIDGGKETVSTVAASGSTETLDLGLGNVHDLTLTADCTITLTGATAGVSCVMEVWLRQDGTGGWTVTWPGSVTWDGGSAPVLQTDPNAVDVVVLQTLDGGTNWIGSGSDTSVSTHITDPTDAHDASAISIADAGTYYTGTDVEAALQEIGAGGIGGSGEDTTFSDVSAPGAAETIDCSAARVYRLTLDANCTITLTGAAGGEAHRVSVLLRQNGTGGWTVSWPGTVYWAGGIAPTLATDPWHTDWVDLISVDGTNWLGVLNGADHDTPTPSAGGSYWPLLTLTST